MNGTQVGGVYYDCTLDTKGLINGEREAARSLDRVGGSFDKLGTRVTAISAAIGAAIGAIAIEGLTSKIVAAQRQFDVMFASLKTMTGGVDQASVAWERLVKFAAQTPFTLEQSVEGFVKLKALGLDPGEKAMTSYGNTAAAMGKSLSQMIEAVADASTGEFERLKEFGIKAKQEGDQVSLTFRGVTTTIGNNAAEITDYLVKIGEVEFAGAMSERMQTLDGDISNLQDSLAALYLSISQSGFGDAIAQGVQAATEAIVEATASIKQGGLSDYFAGLVPFIKAAEVAGVSLAAVIAGRLVAAFVAAAAQAYASATAIGAATIAARGFSAVLAMMGGPIGIAVTALALLALNWDKVGSSASDAASLSEDAAKRIAGALKQGPNLATAELSKQLAEYEGQLAKAEKDAAKLKGGIWGHVDAEDIAQAQAKINALKQAIDQVKTAMVEAQSPPPSDWPTAPEEATPKPKPTATPRTKKAAGAAFDGAGYLASLERATLDGHARIDAAEREALRKNDALLQQKKLSLVEHMQAERLIRENAAQDREKQSQSELERLLQQIQEEEDIRDQAQRSKDAAEAKRQQGREFAIGVQAEADPIARLLLEQERKKALLAQFAMEDQANMQLYAEAKVALEQETERRITEIRMQEEEKRRAAQVAQLQGYGAMFGGMADLAKAFGGEQSKTYKAMFAVSKAFAIADSIIKIQQGIAAAAALPFPANIPAMATVAAQTAGIISTIRGTNYGGGRQYGGPVASGTLYRVNETGRPEMFTGSNGSQYMLPTSRGRVTPADEVGGGAGGGWKIIINNAPPGTTATVDNEARVIEVAVAQAEARVANSLASNTGQVWSALRAGSNVQSRL